MQRAEGREQRAEGRDRREVRGMVLFISVQVFLIDVNPLLWSDARAEFADKVEGHILRFFETDAGLSHIQFFQ
jgi:hypothetical protein